ncbi:hypothetical protein RJ639_018738 [Escallonia herrerae]|uniref:Alpha/beta hydrolase fold-3 domain-containing protein n=1 Tax=Escallonia herrerae TaxID=1293975 RepID=A0AA89AHX5_9ASTE|nr:hypothetical protein RJ639_018738 [Escallonia herrerae]
MVSNTKEVVSELLPFLRIFKDGSVERYLDSPYVPPSLEDPTSAVLSKDIKISPEISARVYLPKLSGTEEKLPILVYFHGGGFLIESAFSVVSHRYVSELVSQSQALVVSVEYRLAPEHPLPTAYEDSWAALQWVASHANGKNGDKEPWLLGHGDFGRVYLGGDSAGANIVHNIAMRASNANKGTYFKKGSPVHEIADAKSLSGGVKIYGAFLCHPYFLGSKPIGSEPIVDHDKGSLYQTWMLAYPLAPDGFDNPMINPFAPHAPQLSGLGCSRLLVCVASDDELRERGVRYFDAVRESGWQGEVELFEVEGEGHAFHVLKPESEKAQGMIKRLAAFIKRL